MLDLFKRKGITTSFYIPGHTVDTFPEISKKVMDAGHEIGHHGYYHEILPAIKRDTETRLMDLAFASYKKHFGIRPTGYRAPYWEFSESTLDLVEEAGFFYDSSMMARDLTPYRIQRFDLAALNVENRIRGFTLPVDNLILPIIGNGSPPVHFRQKYFGIEWRLAIADHGSSSFHPTFLRVASIPSVRVAI